MFSASSIRFRLLLSTAVAASLALPFAAVAQNLPVPPAVNPVIVTNGNTMTVDLQNNEREIFNWNSFDIANNFVVNFIGSD